jgi:hypothetical protein
MHIAGASNRHVGEAGAPDPDIKITPEMIQAGELAFHQVMSHWDYFAEGVPGDDDVSELLCRIFTAMSPSRK